MFVVVPLPKWFASGVIHDVYACCAYRLETGDQGTEASWSSMKVSWLQIKPLSIFIQEHDCVNVIWHDDEFIQLDLRPDPRRPQPLLLDDVPNSC